MADWTCQKTGECCRFGAVVLTASELAELRRAKPEIEPEVIDGGPNGLLAMSTAPTCPYLAEDGLCAVYAVRPYQCRRYVCGREDFTRPAENVAIPLVVYRDRRLLAFYEWNQRKHSGWAKAHGW